MSIAIFTVVMNSLSKHTAKILIANCLPLLVPIETSRLTSLKTIPHQEPFGTKNFSLSALHENQSISIGSQSLQASADDLLAIQQSAVVAEQAAVSMQAAASSVAIEQSTIAVEQSSEYVHSSTVAETVQYEYSESKSLRTFV